jgi:hypothetical protein
MNTISSRFLFALAAPFLAATLLVSVSSATDKPQALTGKISDAMCGASHMMGGDGAACVRACVGKGSKYALVVGDKVYALDTSDKAALDLLDKLADHQATVTGKVTGDSIAVLSVAATK